MEILVGHDDVTSALELVAFDDLALFDFAITRRTPPLLADAPLAFAVVELVEPSRRCVLRRGKHFDWNTDEANSQKRSQSVTRMANSLLFIRYMKNPAPDTPALQKDPDEWKTGDEPMTAAQRSYLETLATDVGESFEGDLTKAEASKLIDELRQRSPRVADE